MYAHHISEMVECLVGSGIVEPEKVGAASKILQKYWTGRIALVWQADDVREVIASKLGVELEDVLVSDARSRRNLAVCFRKS